MAKIRFTLNNYADIATLAGGTWETTLPQANLLEVPRSKVARSTTSTATIDVTLDTAKSVSTFTLGNHDFTEGTLITYTFYTGTFSGVIDTGSFNVTADQAAGTAASNEYQDIKNATWYSEDASFVKVPLSSCLTVRIVVTVGTGSNSTFDIGRLIIGDYTQPTYNISYGHGLSFEEQTKQYRTDSGSLRSDMALPYKKFDFSLNTVSEVDRVLLQRKFADVGKRLDFNVSVFPCDTNEEKLVDYSGIVKLTRIPKFIEFAHNFYKAKYTMEEV